MLARLTSGTPEAAWKGPEHVQTRSATHLWMRIICQSGRTARAQRLSWVGRWGQRLPLRGWDSKEAETWVCPRMGEEHRGRRRPLAAVDTANRQPLLPLYSTVHQARSRQIQEALVKSGLNDPQRHRCQLVSSTPLEVVTDLPDVKDHRKGLKQSISILMAKGGYSKAVL